MCRQSGSLFRPNLFILMKHSDFFSLKGLVAAACVAASLNAVAQEQGSNDKWRGSVEFNPVFYTVKGATPGFDINLTATRKISDYVSAGFGIGVVESFNFSGAPTIPLFVRAHAEDFSKQWSPYFDFDFGYGLNTDDIGLGGLIINPTVGLRYGPVGIGVGYYGTKILKEGYKMGNAVNVRLSYYFGYHRSNSAFIRALRKLEFGIDLGVRFPFGGKVDETASSPYTGFGAPVGTVFEATATNKFTVAGDINLSLLYPVNSNLSVGIMAGFGLAPRKEKTTSALVYPQEYLDRNPGSDKGWTTERKTTDYRTMIPIALRGKYRFRQISVADRFYPFAALDLGVAIVPDTYYASGSFFYWSPTVGLALDVADGHHSVELGLSYVPQKVQKNNYRYSDGHFVEVWEREEPTTTLGGLRISLGYTF